MKITPTNDNAGRQPGEVGKTNGDQQRNHRSFDDLFPETFSSADTRKAPIVSGQCAQVLNLVRKHQPILSLVLTADLAIPEAAARVHDLRAAGWNVITTILPRVTFRGAERRNVAAYSLGVPEWPAPGFLQIGRTSS